MLMYQKNSEKGVSVSQSQVKLLESKGWAKKAGKVEKEKVAVKKAEPAKVATATATPKVMPKVAAKVAAKVAPKQSTVEK